MKRSVIAAMLERVRAAKTGSEELDYDLTKATLVGQLPDRSIFPQWTRSMDAAVNFQANMLPFWWYVLSHKGDRIIFQTGPRDDVPIESTSFIGNSRELAIIGGTLQALLDDQLIARTRQFWHPNGSAAQDIIVPWED